MTPEELETLVRAAELDELVAALISASETERRAARDTARKLRRLGLELGFHQEAAAQVALMGTGTWTHVQRLRPGGTFLSATAWPAIQRVLLALRPKWTGRWLQARLDDMGAEVPFSTVFRLQEAGLYTLGEDPTGYVQSFAALARRSFPEAMESALRTSPEVVETGFFPMFTSDAGLSAGYSFLPRVCAHLAATELVDRDRLLDEVLQAPLRGFARSESRAFLDIYQALEPTAEEDANRLPWLLELCGVAETQVVGWALGRLKPLVKAERVSMEAFAPALARVLALSVKGHPRTALGLAGRIQRTHPDAAALTEALLAGLYHPAPAVVSEVLDLLEAHADPSVVDLLSSAEVPPSQTARLQALVARLGGEVEEAEEVSVDVAQIARLPASARLALGLDNLRAGRLVAVAPGALPLKSPCTPLSTIDEVLELVSVGLAQPDAADFERVLDGAARLADARPDEARLAPLLARMEAEEMAHTNAGGGPRADACALLCAWADRPFDRGWTTMAYGPALLLSARTDEVIAAIRAAAPRQLLATPTHARGLIDPSTFVERLLARPDHGMADRVQALLRLAMPGRAEALARLAGTPWEREPESVALGADLPWQSGPLWLAAARAREPEGRFPDAQRHTPLADGSRPATFHAEVKEQESWRKEIRAARIEVTPPRPTSAARLPRPAALWPTIALHQAIGGGDGAFLWVDPATVQAAAMTWPARPQALFAAALWPVELRRDMPPSAWSPLSPFLEPMLGWPGPFRLESCLLLAVSLTHKDGGLQGLAVDVLVDAIAAGTVVGPELGSAFAWLQRHDRLILSRLGQVMSEVGRLGPLESWVLGEVGLEVLASIQQAPRDLHALLGPLRELLEAHRRGLSPAARVPLEPLSGRSKTATLAKALLALPTRDDLPAAVTAAALEGRLPPMNDEA